MTKSNVRFLIHRSKEYICDECQMSIPSFASNTSTWIVDHLCKMHGVSGDMATVLAHRIITTERNYVDYDDA